MRLAAMTPARASKLDVVLNNAATALDLLEAGVALAPIPGLSLVVKGLSALLGMVKGVRANVGTRCAFIKEIKELATILEKALVKKVEQEVHSFEGDKDVAKQTLQASMTCSKELQSRLVKLSDTIQQLEGSAKGLKGGSGVRGYLQGFIYSSTNADLLSDMEKTLASAIRIFQLEGQISIEDILSDAIQSARKTQEALTHAEEQRILDKLPATDAGYRSVDELKSEFLDGTREELFKEIDTWLADNGNKTPFFFLTGGAGLGKSSIAHQLCTRQDNPKEGLVLGASFFFVRGRGDLESTRAFFPTLALQLAQSQPTLCPHIITAAREYLKQGRDQQMEHAFQGLFRSPFKGKFIELPNPVLVVIDALDECKERELVPQLLKLLLELVTVLPGIRLFVTSRPEPHVMSVLACTDTPDVMHRQSLDNTSEEVVADVQFYITENIHKMPTYAAIIRNNPPLLANLVHRANGVFIYARIALKFLDQYQDFEPEEQFKLLLTSGGEGLSDLDSLYLQILLSAFPAQNWRAPPRCARLQAFLKFVALDDDHLTPATMALLNLNNAGLTAAGIVSMTDRLRSVLLLDDKGRVVPLHATFAEFLLDPQRCIKPLYQVNAVEGHFQFAAACIAAFTFQNFSQCLNLSDDDVEGIRFGKYAECIRYAGLEWNEHLSRARHYGELCKELVIQLIRSRLPVFVRVFRCFDLLGYYIETQALGFHNKGDADMEQIFLKVLKSFAYCGVRWDRIKDTVEFRSIRMGL